MFTAEEIKKLMNANPFVPFKLYMSDGTAYEVPNHDAAFVTKNYVEVGVNFNKKGIVLETVRCAIIHISRVQHLQPA